jgi:hypothetical protein
VLGSTIDSPQQAAVALVGPDANGDASLRLRTVQAVARPGKTCGGEPTLVAADCQRAMAEMAAAPECRPLFTREDGAPGEDCQRLERRMSLSERLGAVKISDASSDPDKVIAAQSQRARHLYACICRGGLCKKTPPPEPPLDDTRYGEWLTHLLDQPARQSELACLAWAAGAVQEHKAAGMTMADALRCSFDDESLSAAREFVATLGERTCP